MTGAILVAYRREVLVSSRRMTAEEAVRRFWSKVAVGRYHECWEWTGGVEHSDGYGRAPKRFSLRGAHRVMYSLIYGPIPDDLCVLHHCDNPPCVNPSHLFLGTRGDNNRDRGRKGRGNPMPGARRSADIKRQKTHCVRGHPRTKENLYTRPNGTRACRTCQRESNRRIRAKHRAANTATD